MTSRLDRLFILLETGSTAATRHAAAKQIGEVQKLYPHELHALLNRLVGYLHSSSWETRIAAAQTVEAILKQVPPWNPELQVVPKKERTGPDANTAAAAAEEDSCQSSGSSSTTASERLLSFDEFDLQQILHKGARLIGSEGNEFDVQEEQPASGGGEEERSLASRLSRQRAVLNDKLGLTTAAKLGVNLTDMITDEDVALTRSGSSYNVNAEKLPVEHILNIKPAANGSGQAQLSCREMNRAKRKARQNTGVSATVVTPTCSRRNSNSNHSTGSNHSNNGTASLAALDEPEKKKLKATERQEIFYSLNAAVPDATGTWVDAVSWPLENFCSRLFIDLFHAKWEVRHGAATALRELINQHAQGAGKAVQQSHEQMDDAHSRWLEDAALRLLCVLCLDRFGDFVSDQVVAPVRETCAQVLGTLVKEIKAPKVQRIVDILLQLIQHKNEWEVRHGGLLGLKYVFVVREELLPIYLPQSISNILIGLLDAVDDVGAVAAATLIPVSSWLPKLLNPAQVSSIVKMLWDLLLDQDELTSACNSFMGLLAAILCLPKAASWVEMEPMAMLVPRLWPFLSHSTSSVRRSTLKTLITLTSADKVKSEPKEEEEKEEQVKDELGQQQKMKLNFGVSDWKWQLLQQALRHIYQRILVEPQADIQALARQVWSNLIEHADLGALLHAACPYVSSWICLSMQPPRLAFDAGVLIRAGGDSSNAGSTSRKRTPRIGDDLGGAILAHSNAALKLYLGGSEATPLELREANFMRARISSSRALGALSHYLVQPAPGVVYTPQTESPTDCYTKVLLGHLNAHSAVQRIVCGLIIAFWALEDEPVRPGPPNLQEKLHQCVSEYVYYDEVAISLTRLLQEAQDFIATLKQNKIPINDFNNAKILTLEQIEAVATTLSENLRIYSLKPKLLDMLEERRRSLQASYQQTTSEQSAYHVSAQAALAGAICALHCLPEKLNPVVKPLMESIKREQCLQLQQLSAEFLVHLMDQVCDRNPSPNSKILNNLCTLLRSDAEHTPKLVMPLQTLKQTQPGDPGATNSCVYYGILTLALQQAVTTTSNRGGGGGGGGGTTPTTATASRGPGRPPAGEILVPTAAATHVELKAQQAKEAEAKQCRIQRLGAACAIEKLCRTFGEHIVDKVAVFQQLMFGKVEQFVKETYDWQLGCILPDLGACNELVSSLQLIETAAPHLHAALHPQMFALLSPLGFIVCHPLKAIRHMAARCIAVLAEIDACQTMQFVVHDLVPLLGKIERLIERQGAVEAIERVVSRLQIKVVPYIVLLVVPLLGAMSDPDESVRLLSTHCFANLVQLMPLDGKAEQLKSEPLQARKTRDREFLDYLFNPKSIPNYQVPVPLSVELRCYQQAGINWLWFLNKYNLHGILCDDMGLGKTLQTICILAGDHLHRQTANLANLPSLVICPPTLTGHWVYEVEKFLAQGSVLRPLHYYGFPVGREKLRSEIGTSCNLVVASYDTVRKDIDFFSGIHFNYCVLDEGHIIKNGKTKSSKAIKRLKANHRLILSGTPIQNNVLELWSLFDFLMPGFLGTEKQFVQRFSRPILASRDAKSSAKEQEAGVLAMEALHRQVLPFLLRRVKEDVLKDLPPKITQDLLCELSPLQLRLYEDFSNKHLKDCLDKLGDSSTPAMVTENLSAKTHIFQALRYLQNVCNHPKLVLRQSEELTQVASQLALSNSSLDDIEHSAKLPALKQLLLDCGIGVQTESVSQHRALIFCQLKTMLDIVEHDLLRRHLPSVTYLRLDGSVPASQRQDIVNNFNSDPSIDVLLLTTLVGGLGLNLTGADTVIFVEHDWNPMKDLQAMDRAHRIGQKKVVNVYRLITRNSLEEKIMGLQKFKILTANTVVSAENASLQTMGTSQIFDLFNGGKDPGAVSGSTAQTQGGMSMNTIIENLPELWSEHQYEEEYDLGNFVQALKK
ncbi:TATA-binding protein-associated factor 172 [Drosophila gunungcola]|uniref:TATA-binding protein-associated factor 172 n=1 Tax=Drosophila gunungcola TaxID=103775 RepID=A0A9P9YY49_9MUSC|nr:TATA-binding protein-associated factor 172 [Drosophila gunungcola]KAI8045264.1 hypothetical protein M5D96_001444 [Drosophila gunungcola]